MFDIKALQQQQTEKAEDLMVTGFDLRWDMAAVVVNTKVCCQNPVNKSTEHTMADCNKGFFPPQCESNVYIYKVFKFKSQEWL